MSAAALSRYRPSGVVSWQAFAGLPGVGLVDSLRAGDPSQIGPFQLLGRLGDGGMGRVFLGQSPGGRKVAVKVVHPHYASDPEFRSRFARPAR